MNRFPLPSDEKLERLIRESFETIPGPDMRRLEQLEQRLSRVSLSSSTRRVNTLPWWIILFLAGGFATAAWWTGTKWFSNEQQLPAATQEKPLPENTVNNDVMPDTGDANQQSGQQEIIEDKESSVIYQRENF